MMKEGVRPYRHCGSNNGPSGKWFPAWVFAILGPGMLAGCVSGNPSQVRATAPAPAVQGEAPTQVPTSTPSPKPVPAKEDDANQLDQIEGKRLGMVDAVNLIIRRHPDLVQASAVLARSKADVGAARSVWYPQVSYQGGIGPNTLWGSATPGLNNNVQGPGVALNQQIWDFGRSGAAIDSAESTVSRRDFDVVATADKLAEKGALSFLDVKRYQAFLAASAKNTGALKLLRDRIQERVVAGASDKSDLALAEMRVEGASGEEIRIRSSLMAAKVILATLVGGMAQHYDDPAPAIAKLRIHEEEPAFDRLPTVAAADKAEKAAAAKITQTKAEVYPSVGVQVGYNRGYYVYQASNDYTALLTISGKLYNPGHKYAVQAAEGDRRAAQAAKESAILDIRGRALSAKENIIGGQQRIATYRRQEQNAVAASEIFFEAYTLGKRTLTELLNTHGEIFQAASSRINAEYDVMAALVQYQNVYGNLRQSLGATATIRGE